MARRLVECVPNFSEGRDAAKVNALAEAVRGVPGVALLDRELDADHNRSVLTFAGPPQKLGRARSATSKILRAKLCSRGRAYHGLNIWKLRSVCADLAVLCGVKNVFISLHHWARDLGVKPTASMCTNPRSKRALFVSLRWFSVGFECHPLLCM